MSRLACVLLAAIAASAAGAVMPAAHGQEDIPQCSDGVDNDDDGLIDVAEDPGCFDDADDTEIDSIRHARDVSGKIGRVKDNFVYWQGRVTVKDGFAECLADQSIRIQRRSSGSTSWRTIRRATTDDAGAYKTTIPDKSGKYRSLVEKDFFDIDDTDHVCLQATSAPVRR